MFYEIEKHIPNILSEIDIFDKDGDLAYQVDSRVLLNKRIIRLYREGKELAGVVERVIPSFEPKFKIYIDGELVGEFVKEFTFFEPRVHITSEIGPIISHGDLVNLDFKLLDEEGNVIAIIDEELTEDIDSYGVEISDDSDDEFILCLLMIIDFLLNDELG